MIVDRAIYDGLAICKVEKMVRRITDRRPKIQRPSRRPKTKSEDLAYTEVGNEEQESIMAEREQWNKIVKRRDLKMSNSVLYYSLIRVEICSVTRTIGAIQCKKN